MNQIDYPKRNLTALAVEQMLAEAGCTAEVSSPTDLKINHVNVVSPETLSTAMTERVRNIAAQAGATINLEVRAPNAKPLLDAAGGLTYAEIEAVRRTADRIAASQGGGNSGFYMPAGARYFGNH